MKQKHFGPGPHPKEYTVQLSVRTEQDLKELQTIVSALETELKRKYPSTGLVRREERSVLTADGVQSTIVSELVFTL